MKHVPIERRERMEIEDFDDWMDDWFVCFECDGDGVIGHDCGEDTCCCLEPEDNMSCQTCDGKGGWKAEETPQPQPPDGAETKGKP